MQNMLNEYLEAINVFYIVYLSISFVLFILMAVFNFKTLEKMSTYRLILLYIALPYLWFRYYVEKWFDIKQKEASTNNIRYIYTEGKEPAELLIVTNCNNIDKTIDKLINDKQIDCWAYFKEGILKLNDEDFALLKKIGVGAYVGVMTRIDSEKKLKDFNATQEEIKISKKLMKLI